MGTVHITSARRTSVLIKKCLQARVICDQSKLIIKTRARANALSIARTWDVCSNEIMGNWEVMPPLIILVCNDLALLPGSHVAQTNWLLCCPHYVFHVAQIQCSDLPLCCPHCVFHVAEIQCPLCCPNCVFLCCPDSVTSMLPTLCFLCCPDSVTSMLPTLCFFLMLPRFSDFYIAHIVVSFLCYLRCFFLCCPLFLLLPRSIIKRFH